MINNNTHRDVLLIGPPVLGNERIFASVPIGIGSICAVLNNKNISCAAVNGNLFFKSDDKLKNTIVHYFPRIIGFSLSQDKIGIYIKRIKFIESSFPHAQLIFGGPFPSMVPEVVIRSFPGSIIVMGEAESIMPELIYTILNGKSLYKFPGIMNIESMNGLNFKPSLLIHDLDSLPIPYRGNKNEQRLYRGPLPIETSRGCSFCCSFCSIAATYKAGNDKGWVWRGKSPERIVNEINFYKREFDVHDFIIVDGNFLGNKSDYRKRLIEIHRLFCEKKIKSTFTIQARIDNLDKKIIQLLKEIGIRRIFCGIESTCDDVLKNLGKSIYTQNIIDNINVMDSAGIEFSIGMMTFNPFATIASIKEDLAFQQQFANKVQEAHVFTRLIPYHGLPIVKKLAQKQKLINVDPLTSNFSGYKLRSKNVLNLYEILKILFSKIIRILGEEISKFENEYEQKQEQASHLRKQLSGIFVDLAYKIVEWLEVKGKTEVQDIIESLSQLTSEHAKSEILDVQLLLDELIKKNRIQNIDTDLRKLYNLTKHIRFELRNN